MARPEAASRPSAHHLCLDELRSAQPNEATKTTKRELYQGITRDNGATWQWTAITQGSTMDNIRPVVPKWDKHPTALLWLRGIYASAQTDSLQVVGTISDP
jgi:hypothetical protein